MLISGNHHLIHQEALKRVQRVDLELSSRLVGA